MNLDHKPLRTALPRFPIFGTTENHTTERDLVLVLHHYINITIYTIIHITYIHICIYTLYIIFPIGFWLKPQGIPNLSSSRRFSKCCRASSVSRWRARRNSLAEQLSDDSFHSMGIFLFFFWILVSLGWVTLGHLSALFQGWSFSHRYFPENMIFLKRSSPIFQ